MKHSLISVLKLYWHLTTDRYTKLFTWWIDSVKLGTVFVVIFMSRQWKKLDHTSHGKSSKQDKRIWLNWVRVFILRIEMNGTVYPFKTISEWCKLTRLCVLSKSMRFPRFINELRKLDFSIYSKSRNKIHSRKAGKSKNCNYLL